MRIVYKNKKVEKQCTSFIQAKKDFPMKVAEKLSKLITFIEAADSLNSIINNPVYSFHNLKGDKKGKYGIDIDGRRGSYRLIVSFEEISNEEIFSRTMFIEDLTIEEVSKHYE